MTPLLPWLLAVAVGGADERAVDATPAVSEAAAPGAAGRSALIIVTGAGGTDEYARDFSEWADRWAIAAERGGIAAVHVGRSSDETSDREQLQQLLAQQAGAVPVRLWLVLIGHGTFDGRAARFNLRGPDVSADELATWLDPLSSPVAVVACFSAGGAFVERLSRPGRLIVSATRNGHEANLSRFGDYLSRAVGDEAADLDKDGQTSLLEAFLIASARTAGFYETSHRLATEHAMLDDDGDGVGTRAVAFQGVRPLRDEETGGRDGLRAHQWHLVPSAGERELSEEQRARRDALELELAGLRDRRAELSEEDYFAGLERLLVDLARLYERVAAPPR